MRESRATLLGALSVLLAMFVVYNANGREISSWDSQPVRAVATEIAARHTLVLDHLVAHLPGLAGRPGFARSLDGHYRSAYPILPGVLGSGVAGLLSAAGAIDLEMPLSPSIVAKVTASLLAAIGVMCVFIVARRQLTAGRAWLLALGFGLGTNIWAVSSQTLWQSETVVATLGGVLCCLAVPVERLTTWRLWVASALLGLAGAARPQLAPAIAVLAVSIALRRRRPADVLTLLPLAAVACTVIALNVQWFGHPLGAVPQLEARHVTDHALSGTFGNPLGGALGLLVSPSRGLLVFSPVVLICVAALSELKRADGRGDLRWWAAAAAVQFVVYSSYSVWWGGHTYGPRYAIDLLPLLAPLAIAALPVALARTLWRRALGVALVWSIVIAATGAFVYPADAWNLGPDDVDRSHGRLWDWRDSQVLRCWQTGMSPMNYKLFRTTPPPSATP